MSNPLQGATLNERYNSGPVPHGGMHVDIYRPTDPSNPNGGANKLGTYKLESASPKIDAELVKRPDVDSGQNGWFIVDKDAEGSAVIQRNIVATPTVQNGDYFDAYLFVDTAGNAVGKRCVIHSPDASIDSGYRKISCSIIVDQNATGVSP